MAFPPFFTLSNMHHLMKKDENILSSLPQFILSIFPYIAGDVHIYIYLVNFQKKKEGYFGNKKFENCTSRDGRFLQESFCLPCNQASLLQTNTHIYILREYFLSVEAMQNKKQTEKRKLSFTAMFIVSHFTFCAD